MISVIYSKGNDLAMIYKIHNVDITMFFYFTLDLEARNQQDFFYKNLRQSQWRRGLQGNTGKLR